MLKYLLFVQCTILLTSFEEIVCPKVDFHIENFSSEDIYYDVKAERDELTGRFILNKNAGANSFRQHVVSYDNILRETLARDDNDPKIVSFSVRGEVHGKYKIKFKFEWQARYYVGNRSLPYEFEIEITWAKIYSNWQPALMAYFDLNHGDLGFKVLDGRRYRNVDAQFSAMPFIFMRSEIDRVIRKRPPLTLHLKNIWRTEDYTITFTSVVNMTEFEDLFPDATTLIED